MVLFTNEKWDFCPFFYPFLEREYGYNKNGIHDDKTTLSKVTIPPILQKQTTKHFVNFTPNAKNFNEGAFPAWREHVGNKYLALNPLTKEGK